MESYHFLQDEMGWEDARSGTDEAEALAEGDDVPVGPPPISLDSPALHTVNTTVPEMDHARGAIRAATSRTAQRTYLNIVLFVIGNLGLVTVTIIAYVLFYNRYIPEQVTTVPVHLQYGHGVNPYGIASLADTNLKTGQAYDVTVSLSLPRSPPNTERGNFMVALHLLDAPSAAKNRPVDFLAPLDMRAQLADRAVLFSSTRPALLPYKDPLVSLASRLLLLPVYVAFPRFEIEELVVPLAERVELLARSTSATPDVLVELQAGQDIHVYGVDVTLKARLVGLRRFMYEHYMLAGVLLCTGFWFFSIVFAGLGWTMLSYATPKATGSEAARRRKGLVKDELVDEYMSDTERTFPSTSKQPPLKYASRVKSEDDWPLADMPPVAPAGAEADDEYDEAGGDAGSLDDRDGHGSWRDSGIGTGVSDMTDGGRVRRRLSKSTLSSR